MIVFSFILQWHGQIDFFINFRIFVSENMHFLFFENSQ